jgi:hypothetical protein
MGLNPGEAYILKLLTKTGDRETRKPIFEIVLTKPEPVNMLSVEDIRVDRATVKWLAPEGHPHLRAFNISCASRDNKFRRELAVKVAAETSPLLEGGGLNSYLFENLPSETEITVSIASVCVLDNHNHNHRSLSRREKTTFVTLPRPPQHLELEGRFCNSLTVSWVPPLMLSTNFHKYKLSIQAPAIGYKNSSELAGDRDAFNFSKLPEIIGSGEPLIELKNSFGLITIWDQLQSHLCTLSSGTVYGFSRLCTRWWGPPFHYCMFCCARD